MKGIIELFILDWKRIIKNPVSIIIIIGLMIIPSLYAWFNILALWDPYGSTSSLPVGVFSADTGANIEQEEINVGDDVIENLKTNHEIAWQFSESEEQLNQAVSSGKYFAGIVIDKNFSSDLVNYAQNENTPKPQINYMVNEKVNAIAPKITDKGVSSIQSEISMNFVGSVTNAMTSSANELGIDIKNNKELYTQVKDLVNQAYNDLPDMEKLVDLSAELNTMFPEIDKQVAALDQYAALSNKFSDFTKDLSAFVIEQDKINTKLESDYQKLVNNQDLVNSYQEINQFNDEAIEHITTVSSQLTSQLTNIQKDIETFNQLDLNNLKTNNESSKVNQNLLKLEQEIKNNPDLSPEQVQVLAGIKSEIETQKSELEKNTMAQVQTLKSELDTSSSNVVDKLQTVNTRITDLTAELKNAKTKIDGVEADIKLTNNDVLSLYHKQYSDLTNSIKQLSETLNTEFPKVDQTIKADISEIQDTYPKFKVNAQNFNRDLQTIWPLYQDSLTNAHEKLQKNIDFDEITDLLAVNPNRMSELFSDPIKIKTNVKYEIPNYGSQSTPFYTVLCLWVGAVLLTSVLTTKYHLEGEKQYSLRQKHLARMLTYISIAIVQALIVTLGNIYLLGTYTVEPLINIICSVFIAICFNVIVYTLASLFDNIGKSFAIVLLVLSVAGGGGNFPIQLSSEFFQRINPLLPFTHAVNLLRETVGGIYKPSFVHAITILSFDTFLFLIIGTVLAPWMIKFTQQIMIKADDSHIFH